MCREDWRQPNRYISRTEAWPIRIATDVPSQACIQPFRRLDRRGQEQERLRQLPNAQEELYPGWQIKGPTARRFTTRACKGQLQQ